MGAGGKRWTGERYMVVLGLANLVGALVSFTYFTFVDPTMPPHAGRLPGIVGFFVGGFILLMTVVNVWADRWARVLNPVDGRWGRHPSKPGDARCSSPMPISATSRPGWRRRVHARWSAT